MKSLDRLEKKIIVYCFLNNTVKGRKRVDLNIDLGRNDSNGISNLSGRRATNPGRRLYFIIVHRTK